MRTWRRDSGTQRERGLRWTTGPANEGEDSADPLYDACLRGDGINAELPCVGGADSLQAGTVLRVKGLGIAVVAVVEHEAAARAFAFAENLFAQRKVTRACSFACDLP